MDLLSDEVRRARFNLPVPFTDYEFHPMGLPGRRPQRWHRLSVGYLCGRSRGSHPWLFLKFSTQVASGSINRFGVRDHLQHPHCRQISVRLFMIGSLRCLLLIEEAFEFSAADDRARADFDRPDRTGDTFECIHIGQREQRPH